jgi:REP element-mobilizing transposase RayT
MSRPLRIEYEGAVYHVTTRGNAGQKIYRDDHDRERFLSLLGRETRQQGWLCHAYCLMENHYHLLLETPEGNLSRGMGRLNGVYTQWFNRRDGRLGHVLQGRYKAIVVEKQSYLLELCRYVVLNPVRAGIVQRVEQWPWSSYRATVGAAVAQEWLFTHWVLAQFGRQCREAQAAYRRFVADGVNGASPWQELRGQMYLGTEAFLVQMKQKVTEKGDDFAQVSRAAIVPDRPTVEQIIKAVANRAGLSEKGVLNRKGHPEPFRLAVYMLRRAGNVSLKEVAALAGISTPRVSQIQKQIEHEGGIEAAFPWARSLARAYKVKC